MSTANPSSTPVPADTDPATTIVHLVRHGEVHNPEGILYGRRPGFHLTERGCRMAERVAETLRGRDVVEVWASPLERAQETAAPIAAALGLGVRPEPRVIESANVFEGKHFGAGPKALRHPATWRHLWNPLRPSWGEPYVEIAARMRAAVSDARAAADGHEAVVVSHQLPIWTLRRHAEGERLFHDPRQRHCTLCSLTSLHFTGDRLTRISYSEPAGDLIPVQDRTATFSSGTAPGPAADDGTP